MPFASDLRYALRSFARTPVVAFTLIGTIALGVGGNAAMFGFIGGLVSSDIETTTTMGTTATTAMAAADAVDRFRRIAALLAGASALVLFLAGSTVTGLLLALARSRAHEMAVRTALGAGRARLIRLCLADGLVISAIGGALGLACGWWAVHLFPLLFFIEDAERLSLAPDLTWMAAAGGLWSAVLLAAAMAPVVPVLRQEPWSVLRRESTGVPADAVRLRNRLAAAQVAVCCVLLVVAGLIRDDLQSTLRTARGLGLGSLLVVNVKGGPSYFEHAQAAVLGLPDVTGVAWTSTLPAGRPSSMRFRTERAAPRTRAIRLDASTLDPAARTAESLQPVAGRSFRMRDGPGAPRVALINAPAADRYFGGDALGRVLEEADGETLEVIGVLPPASAGAGEQPSIFYYAEQVVLPESRRDEVFYTSPDLTRGEADFDVTIVSPTYFTMFADPAIAGRVFDPADAGGAQAGVIGEAGADTWFGGDAVGSALIAPDGGRIEIVGVVRAAPLGAAQRASLPMLFRPVGQAFQAQMSLAIRTSDPGADTRQQVRRALSGAEGGAPISPVWTFEEHLVRNALAPERVATSLVGVMAAVALVLSIAGIHGAMSDLVARRRPELALRVALGARPVRLVTEVVRAGLRLALVGAAAGLGAALLAMPVIAYTVGRVSLPGPAVLGLAIVVVSLLVGASSAVPAWRAVCVDPREIMK